MREGADTKPGTVIILVMCPQDSLTASPRSGPGDVCALRGSGRQPTGFSIQMVLVD